MKQEFINIYDEFRDAVFNKEYYAYRIKKTRRILKNIDIFLAIFAGGSGIAGYAFWETTVFGLQLGQMSFAFLAGFAVMLGIIKPYLKLEDEIERLSSIHSSYSALEHSLDDLVAKVKTDKRVDRNTKTVYDVLRKVRGMLISKEDKSPNQKVTERMQAIVNRRYPKTYFWYPEE